MTGLSYLWIVLFAVGFLALITSAIMSHRSPKRVPRIKNFEDLSSAVESLMTETIDDAVFNRSDDPYVIQWLEHRSKIKQTALSIEKVRLVAAENAAIMELLKSVEDIATYKEEYAQRITQLYIKKELLSGELARAQTEKLLARCTQLREAEVESVYAQKRRLTAEAEAERRIFEGIANEPRSPETSPEKKKGSVQEPVEFPQSSRTREDPQDAGD